MLRTAILLCVCAALVIGVPGLAIAQQAAEAAKTPAADSNALEEVVVTAQRREQKLQDIGISVTALSNEALADRLHAPTGQPVPRARESILVVAATRAPAAKRRFGRRFEGPRTR